MKKLKIFFILTTFMVVGAFAKPRIPTVKGYFTSLSSYNPNDCYTFVSNSGQNEYRLFVLEETNKETNPYKFYFINKSYVTNVEIHLVFYFQSKEEVTEFTNTVNLLDIEKEFASIRNIFIKTSRQPTIVTTDDKKQVQKLIYVFDTAVTKE